MKHRWLILVALLMPALSASSIDVDGDTNIVLHTGDELIFGIDVEDYLNEAPIYGAPQMPSNLGFTLVTGPTLSSATFSAGIESISGAGSETLGGTLGFHPGIFQSGYYSGPVSTLSGSFSFSPDNAANLFAGGLALLYFEDLGGTVNIGFSPYVVPGDLYANAAGGGVSVGAYTYSAMLVRSSENPVPEPDSGSLLLAGGAAMCAAALFLRYLQPAHRGRIP
ncbi:MAG TPA: hypothetical protein VKV17_14210 [Bryobacteraceae bacterium]|nr:hypothetical protein [Bryobacteraceae bacterium]